MADNGELRLGRSGSLGRRGLPKIQTNKTEWSEEVCHDDSATPVKAQTLGELHSLQKKRSTPTTPIRGVGFGASQPAGAVFAAISEEDRHQQQLQSISASLASLTRETGPKLVKGDPERKSESQIKPTHYSAAPPSIGISSDSALKFTHVLYNSPFYFHLPVDL